MSWLDNFFTNAIRRVQSNGVALPQENALNFISGFTITDDPVNGRTNLTFTAAGSPGSGFPASQAVAVSSDTTISKQLLYSIHPAGTGFVITPDTSTPGFNWFAFDGSPFASTGAQSVSPENPVVAENRGLSSTPQFDSNQGYVFNRKGQSAIFASADDGASVSNALKTLAEYKPDYESLLGLKSAASHIGFVGMSTLNSPAKVGSIPAVTRSGAILKGLTLGTNAFYLTQGNGIIVRSFASVAPSVPYFTNIPLDDIIGTEGGPADTLSASSPSLIPYDMSFGCDNRLYVITNHGVARLTHPWYSVATRSSADRPPAVESLLSGTSHMYVSIPVPQPTDRVLATFTETLTSTAPRTPSFVYACLSTSLANIAVINADTMRVEATDQPITGLPSGADTLVDWVFDSQSPFHGAWYILALSSGTNDFHLIRMAAGSLAVVAAATAVFNETPGPRYKIDVDPATGLVFFSDGGTVYRFDPNTNTVTNNTGLGGVTTGYVLSMGATDELSVINHDTGGTLKANRLTNVSGAMNFDAVNVASASATDDFPTDPNSGTSWVDYQADFTGSGGHYQALDLTNGVAWTYDHTAPQTMVPVELSGFGGWLKVGLVQPKRIVTQPSANPYTIDLTVDDYVKTASNAQVIKLPLITTAVRVGAQVTVKCAFATATLNGNGKNIDGSATQSMVLHDRLTVVWDGTEWGVT